MSSEQTSLQFFSFNNTPNVAADLCTILNKLNIFITYEQYKPSQSIIKNHSNSASSHYFANPFALRDISSKLFIKKAPIVLLSDIKARDTPLSIPLLFPRIIKQKIPIIIDQCDDIQKTLLYTKPNLTFKQIPDSLHSKNTIVQTLRTRANSKNIFKNACISLTQISGLPKPVQDFITLVIQNKPYKDIPEFKINLLLLADFQTRYIPLFSNLETSLINTKQPLISILSAYSFLVNDLSFSVFKSFVLSTFQKNFQYLPQIYRLFEQLQNIRTHADLLTFLFKHIWRTPENQSKVTKKEKNLAFQIITSGIILHRSQTDANYWQQAIFLSQIEKESSLYQAFITELQNYAKNGIASSQHSNSFLLQNHLFKTFHYYANFFTPNISGNLKSKTEENLLKNYFFPILFTGKEEAPNKHVLPIDMDMLRKKKLYYSPSVLASTYFGLIDQIMHATVRTFTAEGLVKLTERYGSNFFSLLYELVVANKLLPITQFTFSEWLKKSRLLTRLGDKGYVSASQNKEEIITIKNLLQQQNPFSKNYTDVMFFQDFEVAVQSKDQFIAQLKKLAKNAAKGSAVDLLASLLNKSETDLWFAIINKTLPPSNLQKKWISFVQKLIIANNLMADNLSSRIILKVPASLKNLLYLGNIIKVELNKKQVQIYFTVANTNDIQKLDALSAKCLSTLKKFLSHPLNREFTHLIKLLDNLTLVMQPYFHLLSLQTIDLLLHNLYQQDSYLKRPTVTEIKNKFPDRVKLFIGNLDTIKVNSFLQNNNPGHTKNEINSISIANCLQSILNYYTVSDILEKTYANTSFLLKFLTYSTAIEFKTDKLWKDFIDNLTLFKNLLSQSVINLKEEELVRIHTIANRMHQIVSKIKPAKNPQNSVLGSLLTSWRRQFPDRTYNFDIYNEFLSLGEIGKESNMLIQMRNINSLFSLVADKQCIIILPEVHKQFHFDYIIKIGHLLLNYKPNTFFYLNTSYFSQEQLLTASASFHPYGFFKTADLSE